MTGGFWEYGKNGGHLRHTLPETNIAPGIDGWKTTFLLGRPISRCEPLVSGSVNYASISVISPLGEPRSLRKTTVGRPLDADSHRDLHLLQGSHS